MNAQDFFPYTLWAFGMPMCVQYYEIALDWWSRLRNKGHGLVFPPAFSADLKESISPSME